MTRIQRFWACERFLVRGWESAINRAPRQQTLSMARMLWDMCAISAPPVPLRAAGRPLASEVGRPAFCIVAYKRPLNADTEIFKVRRKKYPSFDPPSDFIRTY